MEILEIPLESEVNIPNDKIRFIMIHPCLEGKIKNTGQGFRFARQRKNQVALVESALGLAKYHPSDGTSPTDFIIFPELSVPEDALPMIEKALQDSRFHNSVVMGGLECVDAGTFKNLMNDSDNPEENKRASKDIGLHMVVNTCFIYIRTPDQLLKYYQPKMSASPPEQRLQKLYEGDFLLLFKTASFAFAQIICFDAIVATGNQLDTLAGRVLTRLKQLGTPTRLLKIALLFVLQHNDDPGNEDFKRFAKAVLDYEKEFKIDTVVFANTAAQKCGHSERYGKSRFHFITPKYQSTDKDTPDPPWTFSLKTEDSVKYSQFREDGPCAHSFEYVPPSATSTFSGGGNRYPFKNALVHTIENNHVNRQGEPINGLWKSIFDFLPEDLPATDTKSRWSTPRCSAGGDLNAALEEKFEEIRGNLLLDGLQLSRLREIADVLFLAYDDNQTRKRIANPDFWEENYEGEGIRDLASGLTILAILGDVALVEPCLSEVHTALFRKAQTEFYLTILDNPNNEMKQLQLRSNYLKYVEENGNVRWGETDWRKDTLILICTGNSNPSDDAVVKCVRYFSTSDRGGILPADLAPSKKGRFTTIEGRGSFYVYSLDKLRGDLEYPCDQIMPRWRKKLEPLRG